PVPDSVTIDENSVVSLIYPVEPLDERVEDLKLEEYSWGTKITLQADVLFEFDKARLRSQALAVLSNVAVLLHKRITSTIQIDGYTDSRGLDKYNLALSLRRAEAVRDFFVESGIPSKLMRVAGHGKADPVAPNKHPDGSDDPEGRQNNRRVEIRILKPVKR